MAIFYNPLTRPALPHTLVYDDGLAPDDGFLKFHREVDGVFTHASFAEMVKRDVTGPQWWYESNGLHSGHTVGSWDFTAVTAENQPRYHHGINWGNAYFISRDAAEEWLIQSSICRYNLSYDEFGDVWNVHYHY